MGETTTRERKKEESAGKVQTTVPTLNPPPLVPAADQKLHCITYNKCIVAIFDRCMAENCHLMRSLHSIQIKYQQQQHTRMDRGLHELRFLS